MFYVLSRFLSFIFYPLMDHKEDLKVRVSWKKLPELLKRVRAIEKKLEENDKK